MSLPPGRQIRTLIEASRRLEKLAISSETLAKECYSRAIEGEQVLKLNAYTNLCCYEDVVSQARASDERRARNQAKSPLDGVPVAIKANIAVKTMPLTAASKILTTRSSAPCGYDADITTRLLRDAGAVLIGVTNMDEFGMGSLGNHSPVHGPAINPLSTSSKALSPGGSSSGSAAAVAHGSCFLALGTDTGGSIRLPSSWCGVTGFKPTYGVVSRYGVVSYASSLDTVGWIAPTPACTALAFPYLVNIKNRTCGDSTALYYNNPRLIAQQQRDSSPQKSLTGIKIGIPAAFSVHPCPSYVEHIWSKAAKILQTAGAEIVIIPTNVLTPNSIKTSLSAYYVLACAEASSNLARYDGLRYGASLDQLKEEIQISMTDVEGDAKRTPLERQYSAVRAMGFGPEVIRRILAGTAVLSSDRFHTHYEAAARQRAILRREFDKAFDRSTDGVDVMLAPTSLSLPCPLNEGDQFTADSTEMLANDVMTVPLSLAGLPTVSVPVALDSSEGIQGSEYENIKSLGLQVFGPQMGEEVVFKVASTLFENDVADHARERIPVE